MVARAPDERGVEHAALQFLLVARGGFVSFALIVDIVIEPGGVQRRLPPVGIAEEAFLESGDKIGAFFQILRKIETSEKIFLFCAFSGSASPAGDSETTTNFLPPAHFTGKPADVSCSAIRISRRFCL